MSGAEGEAYDYLVNRALFWIGLFISIGTAAGIGFKVAAWLRKKVNEDKDELRHEIRHGIDMQTVTLKQYVDEVAKPAAARRERHEFILEQLIKRVEALEQQMGLNMQIILQNQKDIREFLEESRSRP